MKQQRKLKYSFFVWQLLIIGGFAGQTIAACVGDFGRCTCREEPLTTTRVMCLGVPFEEVKTTLERNTQLSNIDRLDLVPEIERNTFIPAYVLGGKRVQIIHLASCGNGDKIEIDENAFRSSSTYTQEFAIYDCDVSNLTWSFLGDFTTLSTLHLEGASQIQSLEYLPSLQSVKTLMIINSEGFNFKFPGPKLSGLKNLIMKENTQLNDVAITAILATLSEAKGLEFLSLSNSPSISRIPDNINVLPGLNSLDMSECAAIKSVSDNSLSFSPSVKLLDLSQASLASISNNAFGKSYYGNASIFLNNNKLTEFRSAVFLTVLKDMEASYGTGRVNILNNPIKCDDCLLAWLIRDFKELVDFVDGTCTNGTRFGELNSSWYDDQMCAVITTTVTSTEPTTTSTADSTGSSTGRNTTGQATITTSSTLTNESSTPVDPNNPSTREETTGDITTSTTKATAATGTTNPGETQQPPSADDYDTLFYILFGVLGAIGLILIVGFIYIGLKTSKSNKKKNEPVRSSDNTSFSSANTIDPRTFDQRNNVSYIRMPEVRPPEANPRSPAPAKPPQFQTGVSVRGTVPMSKSYSSQNYYPSAGRPRGLRRVEF